jgi:proline iminopeptidase
MSHLTLYPFLKPYRQFRLAVEPPHELHVEESGNPAGLPVVFLHGGPGAGTESYHRRFFDPEKYRIVLFDQRGCGYSTPHACLENNTTQAMIADIERIRRSLNIDRWVVFGGSWGSTLGLAYAQSCPSRVLGLILRGVFLCRERDIQWFYQDGASRIFPDYWKDFVALIPEASRDNILAAYHRMLTGSDEVGRMAAAKAWSIWEGRTATLKANPDVVKHFANPHVALSLARIECHYFVNQSFLEPDQLLRSAQRLHGIPGVIVHGRYDVICPLEQAYALREVWPEAKLEIVPEAGHAAGEPGIVDALIRATREIAALYS